MAQVSAAYASSICLRSSRSFHLSLRSAAQSFEQVTWRPVKHLFIESCLVYCTCKQKHWFCWLPSVSDHLETEDLKNIWSGIEMIKCHLYWIVRSESETELPQIGSNFTRSWLPCEVKGASAGWWALHVKVSMLKCQTKKVDRCAFPRLRAYEAQTSACQVPEGNKSP